MAQQENPDRQPGLCGLRWGQALWRRGGDQKRGRRRVGKLKDSIYFSNPSLSPTSCGPRK